MKVLSLLLQLLLTEYYEINGFIFFPTQKQQGHHGYHRHQLRSSDGVTGLLMNQLPGSGDTNRWDQEQTISVRRKRFAVVGAGWGGWGAAKALCESGVDAEVIILDANPDPTGGTPYLSATGKPVEAGTRGFWMDYPNINSLCAELGLKENEVFTDFTNSSFYSPDGLEATAPVFSNIKLPDFENIPFLSGFSGQRLPELPSPLGQVLATFPLFEENSYRRPLVARWLAVGHSRLLRRR